MVKKKRSMGGRPEPHWRYVERVVALLENALAPGARVEHDAQVLDYEAGVLRQCDVVIRQGEQPRETLTIVEVQDRNKRVTLPIFEGWYRKREKVRAQHLICVSQKGFSRSVESEVKRLGNTVRLVELRELEYTAWPVKFNDGKLPVFWPEMEVESYSLKTVENKSPALKFKREDVEFTRNGVPVQVLSIFDEYFPAIDVPPNEVEDIANQKIEFGKDDVVIMSWDGDSARVISFTRHVRVKAERTELTMSVSEYKQVDYEGALALAITGTGMKDGREASLSMVYRPKPDGLLQLAAIQVVGAFNEPPLVGIHFRVDAHGAIGGVEQGPGPG